MGVPRPRYGAAVGPAPLIPPPGPISPPSEEPAVPMEPGPPPGAGGSPPSAPPERPPDPEVTWGGWGGRVRPPSVGQDGGEGEEEEERGGGALPCPTQPLPHGGLRGGAGAGRDSLGGRPTAHGGPLESLRGCPTVAGTSVPPPPNLHLWGAPRRQGGEGGVRLWSGGVAPRLWGLPHIFWGCPTY